jgi:pimeloyl-ACP methyl ester carboxylesterase
VTIVLPDPVDVFDAEMADGAVLRLRRHGNPAGPRLILAHGNGFATDAYFPFWKNLATDFEIVIHDLRNHGQNPRAGSLGHTLRQCSLDHQTVVEAVRNRFGAKPTVGIYHSVSSLAAILQTVDRGLIWDGLVLVDPPLIAAPGHRLHESCFKFEMVLANWAMKRPDRFTHPDELAAQFRDTKLMQLWVDGAHELLARAVLREEAGEWVLSCPRELEATLYVQNSYSGLWARLPELRAMQDRLRFLSADGDLADATPNTGVGKVLREDFGFCVDIIERTTHMLQIERPEAAVDSVRRFLGEIGITA